MTQTDAFCGWCHEMKLTPDNGFCKKHKKKIAEVELEVTQEGHKFMLPTCVRCSECLKGEKP